MTITDVQLADSVTHLATHSRGAVVIAASHGGIYAAYVAAKAGVAGIILNDASVGLEGAGIAGLTFLDPAGIPAATIDYRSARIGDGVDSAARGVISFANQLAAALGVKAGMSAQDAANKMASSIRPLSPAIPLVEETHTALQIDRAVRPVVLVDSASLVGSEDSSAVVVTGSHGGLLGGRPESAIKVPVFAAIYNDAGVGADGAGISRLPALDARKIAGVTVAASSARIGDARSSYATGTLSFVNKTARDIGARVGMSASTFAELASSVR